MFDPTLVEKPRQPPLSYAFTLPVTSLFMRTRNSSNDGPSEAVDSELTTDSEVPEVENQGCHFKIDSGIQYYYYYYYYYYYGNDTRSTLSEQLKWHIIVSDDGVNSAVYENTSALYKANDDWFSNADKISVLLSKANADWALADRQIMIYDYLKHTTESTTQQYFIQPKAE